MFFLYYVSCITEYSQGCRIHVHFVDFSTIFHSYLYCDRNTCQICFVLLFLLDLVPIPWCYLVFCCFAFFLFPDSCQGAQLPSSSKFQVSLKSLIGSKQIAELTLALAHHLFCLSGHLETSTFPWVFCFILEKNWDRRGVETFFLWISFVAVNSAAIRK